MLEMMTRCLLVVLVVAWPLQLHAQQLTRATLSGTVIDAETNEPLPGVNVFVAGTTLGAATDEDGAFAMRLPAQHQFEVVASMLGYQVEAKLIRRAELPPEGLTFRLQRVSLELGTVEVVAEDPTAWRKNLNRFTALLFSTTAYGKRCTLVNPEALTFLFDEGEDVLHATAHEALIIENHALGYRITIHEPFLEGKEALLRWGGKIQFEEMDAENARTRRRWLRNRRRVYEGSNRHFLAALVADRVIQEGFKAYYVDQPGFTSKREPIDEEMEERNLMDEIVPQPQNDSEERPPLLEDGLTDDTRTLRFAGFLYVTYLKEAAPTEYTAYLNKYGLQPDRLRSGLPSESSWIPIQSSWITLPQGFVTIDAHGNEYGDYMITRFGYWAWERLGEQLPYNYEPDS